MIYWKALLTPIYMRRMNLEFSDGNRTPYAEVFIFGVRVVRWGLVS
jgi:hypothetical protein